MGNEDKGAGVDLERIQQHVLGTHVEVVGGFIEQQEIRRPQKHPRQGIAVALAAGKHSDTLEDVILRKQEAPEQAAQLRLGARRYAGKVIQQACFGIERLILVLREVVWVRVVAQAIFSG